jgi:hypothetical protein
MQSIGFVIFCNEGNQESYEGLVNKILELTVPKNIERIKIFPLYIGEGPSYVENKNIGHIDIEEITGKNVLNALEPRLYNCALDHVLRTNVDYVIFFRDKDELIYENLLVYYMWLFEKSHNEDFIGAVCPKHALFKPSQPPKTHKMWYTDDAHIRGICLKTKHMKEVGPFDEYLKNKLFEIDYVSRMSLHVLRLTRVGKEEMAMYKLSDEYISKANEPTEYLRKPIGVWFTHKWSNNGKYKDFISCRVSSEPVSNLNFEEIFTQYQELESLISKRGQAYIEDETTIESIKFSRAFNKKYFLKCNTTPFILDFSCPEFSSYNHTRLEYPDLLWKADPAR